VEGDISGGNISWPDSISEQSPGGEHFDLR